MSWYREQDAKENRERVPAPTTCIHGDLTCEPCRYLDGQHVPAGTTFSTEPALEPVRVQTIAGPVERRDDFRTRHIVDCLDMLCGWIGARIETADTDEEKARLTGQLEQCDLARERIKAGS